MIWFSLAMTSFVGAGSCSGESGVDSIPRPLLLLNLISNVGEPGASCAREDLGLVVEPDGAEGAGDRGC